MVLAGWEHNQSLSHFRVFFYTQKLDQNFTFLELFSARFNSCTEKSIFIIFWSSAYSTCCILHLAPMTYVLLFILERFISQTTHMIPSFESWMWTTCMSVNSVLNLLYKNSHHIDTCSVHKCYVGLYICLYTNTHTSSVNIYVITAGMSTIIIAFAHGF